MIVKNEEESLPNCLSSVQGLFDELIVVDTGSTDRTVEIAQRFGAKIHYFEWVDDFSAARNVSIKHAIGEWILWLDADDTLSEAFHAEVRRLLSYPKDHAFYFRLENVGGDESICYQLRMFPNLPGIEYTMPVHEQILPALIRRGVTKMINADVSVIHTGYTDAQTISAKNAKYLRIMERWLQTQPQDYVTHAHMARIYHTEGRNEEACRAYRQIVANEKCRVENALIYHSSWIFLGRSYLNLRAYDDALSAFEEALKLVPDDDIACMCFGEAYTLMDEPESAIPFLEKIRDKGGVEVSFLPVEVNSLNYHARRFLGANYEKLDRADDASTEYRAAIAMDARRTEAPTALAQLLANRGDVSGAHGVLEDAIQANPDQPEHYVNQAALYIDKQQYDEAEKALRMALDQNPTPSRAHFLQGRLHRLRGNLESAVHAYQAAVEANPNAIEAHTDLGHLYVDLDQPDNAKDAFASAIRVCQETEQTPSIDVRLGYAYSCACCGEREAATQAYQDVAGQLESAPTEVEEAVDSWVGLGQVLLDDGLYAMARYAMKTAIVLNPGAHSAAEGLGDVLMRMARYSEAQTQYENALQLAPNHREIFFKLGDCYLKSGAHDVAQMCYRQGLRGGDLPERGA